LNLRRLICEVLNCLKKIGISIGTNRIVGMQKVAIPISSGTTTVVYVVVPRIFERELKA